jgi:thiazole/oxazole-forming peptide maturase SagD family component
VLAVVHDPAGRRPVLAVGSAARWTLADACGAAAIEAHQAWNWMYEEHNRSTSTFSAALRAADLPREMKSHAFLHGFSEMAPHVAHLLDMSAPVSSRRDSVTRPGDPGEELEVVVRSLVQHGFDPLAIDIATPEFKPFGVQVFKVLVPGLVPLSVGKWCRHLANERIVRVPVDMAWPHRGPLPPDRGCPHPLP